MERLPWRDEVQRTQLVSAVASREMSLLFTIAVYHRCLLSLFTIAVYYPVPGAVCLDFL
jgi:hypothetical protein